MPRTIRFKLLIAPGFAWGLENQTKVFQKAPGPNFGKPRETRQIFFDALPLCKISGL